ncbi:MAG: hydrogenase maturation nickel metallochaperone HypA/HybF [Pseudobdellovibrionaceae bacterium]
MHETGLLKNMLKTISDLAERENAKQVASITIQIGALAQISPEHLQEHFDIESKGSIAEGADLIVEVSDNVIDPHAQEIILKNIEVVDENPDLK